MEEADPTIPLVLPDALLEYFSNDTTHFTCSELSEDAEHLLQHFIRVTTPQAIYLFKDHENSLYVTSDPLEIATRKHKTVFALLKSAIPISQNEPILSQVNTVSITLENKSLTAIHDLLSFVVSPYFESLTVDNETNNLQSYSQARRKFKELDHSLLHLSSHVLAPDLLLSIPPQIRTVLASSDLDISHDLTLLNELTSLVNDWIRQIHAVTSLSQDISDGTTIEDEISFWSSRQEALESIIHQITSPEVKNAISLLSKAKRFQTTLLFQDNLGLSERLEETKSLNTLFKEIPLSSLASASTDVHQFTSTVNSIFTHLKRWKPAASLSITKMIQILDLIIRHIASCLISLLDTQDLLLLPMEEFNGVWRASLAPLQETIDTNTKFMLNVLRELMRRRQSKFMVLKIDQSPITQIFHQIDRISDIKVKHHNLLAMLALFRGRGNITDDLVAAYHKHIISSNPFDFSKQGISIFASEEQSYLHVYLETSSHIRHLLSHRLEKCATIHEYHALFQKFSSDSSISVVPLVDDKFKQRILDMIHTELLDLLKTAASPQGVETDLYHTNDQDNLISQLCWNHQVLAKINFYLNSLESFLGSKWSLFAVGAKIQQECSLYIENNNPEDLIRSWTTKARDTCASFDSSKYVFVPSNEDNLKYMVVDFDADIAPFTYEKNIILDLRYLLPTDLLSQIESFEVIRPILQSLADHLQIWEHCCLDEKSKCSQGKELEPLLENQKQCVVELINPIRKVTWGLLLTDTGVRAAGLSDSTADDSSSLLAISNFELQTYTLLTQKTLIDKVVSKLSSNYLQNLLSCSFDDDSINDVIGEIFSQREVFWRKGYSNMNALDEYLVQEVHKTLDQKFCQFLKCLQSEVEGHELKSELILRRARHTVLFEGGVYLINPPVSTTKSEWISVVNEKIKILNKVSFIDHNGNSRKIWDSQDCNSSAKFAKLLLKFDEISKQCDSFCLKWALLQDFMSGDAEVALLDDHDLQHWIEKVRQLLEVKKLLEIPQGLWSFANGSGILFSSIQAKTLASFKTVEIRFLDSVKLIVYDSALKIIRQVKAFESLLLSPLSLLLDCGPLIKSIASLFETEAQLARYDVDKEGVKVCQKMLRRLNANLLINWIDADVLESRLSAPRSMLASRFEFIESNKNVIQTNLKSYASNIREQSAVVKDEWESKFIAGDEDPAIALSIIAAFQKRFADISGEFNMLLRIAEKLKLELDGSRIHFPDDIEAVKNIWVTIHASYTQLLEIHNQRWLDLHPRTFKSHIDELLKKSKSFPEEVKRNPAFAQFQASVNNLLQEVPLLTELKNDAIKERHWKKIFMILNQEPIDLKSMRILDVSKINLALNESAIRSIITQAANEQVIEAAIEGIRTTWSQMVFQTFDFHGKCRLIRNWDSLFDQCNDDISSLASMKNSVFHSGFDKERSEMEDKLSNLLEILNLWVEVQKKWAYLDGVFDDNHEIHSSLPVETSRFINISFEFTNLLKKISNFTLVIDILSLRNLQETLQKIYNSLEKTQLGLSEYLEKQRRQFPRLYFVGNEDLLELIGGLKDQQMINRHVKLMFLGVDRLVFDDSGYKITSIVSPEEEILSLNMPVSLLKHQEMTHWLLDLESQIKLSLSKSIDEAFKALCHLLEHFDHKSYFEFVNNHPFQAVIVATQLYFTRQVESSDDSLVNKAEFYQQLVRDLAKLTELASSNLDLKKVENLIIELIRQRNVIESLKLAGHHEKINLRHQQQLFYFRSNCTDPLNHIVIKQGRSEFTYGYEYHGVVERLVSTPLLDRNAFAMTQAISRSFGGSPYGPAGTGKTESIKALGYNLGKAVKVFNCDDSFDFKSMGRIFLGLCKVGCWGCFDEFNRLNLSILSSLSSQVELIQKALRGDHKSIDIANTVTSVSPETAIFITMNPGYAGRNELPENLKNLFRLYPVKRPDMEMIVEVILTSKRFSHSSELSKRIVPLFNDLGSLCSKQNHYDFGLRALKSILRMCESDSSGSGSSSFDEEAASIVRGLKMSILPKMVKTDEAVFERLLEQYFPLLGGTEVDDVQFAEGLKSEFERKGLQVSESLIAKGCQVSRIQANHHGFMLIGQSPSAKTTVFNTTLATMARFSNIKNDVFRIDCKVLSKETLFGLLDPVTGEWTDGLFTKILRSALSNMRGEQNKRIWIVFDGDIDPEWAENLNSVLDDNKLLTLPTGERLELNNNIRIVFEVDSLAFTTPATTSRCGVVWFDESLLEPFWSWNRFVSSLRKEAIAVNEPIDQSLFMGKQMSLQTLIADNVDTILSKDVFDSVLAEAKCCNHIMDFDGLRGQNALQTYFSAEIEHLAAYHAKHEDVIVEEIDSFVSKALVHCLVMAFAGDCSQEERDRVARFIGTLGPFRHVEIPRHISESYVAIPSFEWASWALRVDQVDLEPHQVMDPSIIVPTVDTVSHESMIHSVINSHSPLILCGPPGSGKTMTLFKALRQLPTLDLISLNFSKDTSPQTLLALLEQHCEYRKSNKGLILAPKLEGKWVVVFCDEINLPAADNYGTQKVIALMRQIVEHGGFWRAKDKEWVQCVNLQFVGACNDPNDPGRQRLPSRFMRHVCLVQVGYPGENSLKQIYQTFNRATLKCAPDLRSFSDPLTVAMLDVYNMSRSEFTTSKMSHYVYSPRELTRWCRGILETVISVAYSELWQLLRLWFHEGLRLFCDRLFGDTERAWTKKLLKDVCRSNFPHTNLEQALAEPVLYSKWLSSEYEVVEPGELTAFVRERLRVFSEEEVNVDLVLHHDMLDHILRIDRVLRQHQGHMILVGPSTSGKSTLARFVAWINGLKTVQLRVHSKYTIEDFDNTLRDILLRCAKGERMCFLIDESSILETSFIERMNTLLANSEVPGLFQGEDLASLFRLCGVEATAQGLLLDSEDELYDWFVKQVSINLHVIFTVSGTGGGSGDEIRPQVHSSPALFNRCVLNWMGDWTDSSLVEVGQKLVLSLPIDTPSQSGTVYRDLVVRAFVYIHRCVGVYPRKFVLFVLKFVEVFMKTQGELEANQKSINSGLDKLRETMLEVLVMRELLSERNKTLVAKDTDARQMLNKMIVDQNEAERKKEFSIATQAELEKQEVEINKRRAVVMDDLQLAEPAVLDAQRGVQNIKKQHLTEMRSMSNPPAAVKLAMESVCVLLGYNVGSWRDVQLVVRKDDFITSIVSYDSESQLTPELSRHMEATYLSRPDFNFDAVNRASKACGPLLQWVIAQLRYFDILKKVGPLKEEVDYLEATARKSRAQLIAIAEMIAELEASIEEYKNKYSELVRETELIKVEIQATEQKVSRSVQLIEKLSRERERWITSIKLYEESKRQLVGNSILAAAAVVYMGHLDQKQRQETLAKWQRVLSDALIEYTASASLLSALCTTKDRRCWASCGLTEDVLFQENFAIGGQCKFPFIVDPSGGIKDVWVRSREPKKIAVTSFNNPAFVKHVEDAMRFGGTILIEDAEQYDPILDLVLREDFTYNGGRRLVAFGLKTIDFLENFNLVLYTKDAWARVSPFVASRTSLLNFTVTSSNLENQALDITLKHVDSLLYQRREEIVSLQSEYQVKSLQLRQTLLATLANMAGTILESDEAVEALESLEAQSSDMDVKMSESMLVKAEVDEIRDRYSDIADHCKGLFEILMRLSRKNPLYNFSIGLFVEVFTSVLGRMEASFDFSLFISSLYRELYLRMAATLRSFDRDVFGLALTRLFFKIEYGAHVIQCLDILLPINGPTVQNVQEALKLCLAEGIADGVEKDRWMEVVLANKNNAAFSLLKPVFEAVLRVSDHTLLEALAQLSKVVFGQPWSDIDLFGLSDWAKLRKVPILVATSEGYDPSFRIEQLAKEANCSFAAVALGSKEGIQLAKHELLRSMASGSWLVIQNIHLSRPWMADLPRQLEAVNPHQNFRLFLTCLLSSTELPAGLLSTATDITHEVAPVFKHTLKDSFSLLQGSITNDTFRLVAFLLSWFHAQVHERLKYVPLAFKKNYDINETDFTAAGAYVERIFQSAAVSSEVPWEEIKFVVVDIVYGGKISEPEDLQKCRELANQLFLDRSLDYNFSLVETSTLSIPASEEFLAWLSELPEVPPLNWIGLPEGGLRHVQEKKAVSVAKETGDIGF